jgi:hypothetical protein
VTALSPGQIVALRNLARKQAGEAVDWINIADARALTDLGLAVRTGGGWTLTPAGAAALSAQIDPTEAKPISTLPVMKRPTK